MEQLKQVIMTNRPSISQTSLRTYLSTLKGIHKHVFGDKEIVLEDFHEADKIIDSYQDLEPSKRKSKMNALYILTSLQIYHEHMMDDLDAHKVKVDTREPTEKQKENCITKKDIDDKLFEMEDKINGWFKAKDFAKIQDYLILVLYGGTYIAPRRALDFTEFKTKNANKDTDNFFKLTHTNNKMMMTLYFNNFKTKQRGQDAVQVPSELMNILLRWKRINPTDYLLFDSRRQKLDAVKLNQRIEKIFGRKVGVNGFRHCYMTSKYGHLIEQEKNMEEDFKAMGSSIQMKNVYVQTD
jgi:hypothetical protein